MKTPASISRVMPSPSRGWSFVAALALIVACVAYGAPAQKGGPTQGQPAPEIQGTDADGKSFKLSDYKGKVVLLDFWGDW